MNAASASHATSLAAINKSCQNFLKYGNPGGQVNLYLCREGYIVGYNYQTKQPTWVAYHLTANSVAKSIKRHDKFMPDPEVPKKYQAQLSDYKKVAMIVGI